MPEVSKELLIVLKSMYEEEGAKKAIASLDAVARKEREAKQKQQESATAAEKALEASNRKAVGAMALGAAFMATVISVQRSYVQTAKFSEETSRQWIATTDKIEKSTFRIGRVLTKDFMPGYKLLGDVADKFAGATESMPAVTGGIVMMGGLLSLGKMMSGAGARFGMPALAGAGKGLAGIIGGFGGAALGGLLLGGGVANALGETEGGQKMGFIPKETEKLLVVAVHGLSKIWDEMTGSNTAGRNALNVGKTFGLYGNEGEGDTKTIPDEMLLEMRQFYQQEENAQRQHNIATYRANRDFNRQMQYAQEDYNKTVFRANRDFQISMRYAQEDYQKMTFRANRDFYRQMAYQEQDYNRGKMIATRDFNISQRRAEEDFNRTRARALQDHNWSMRMAFLQGDSMGVFMQTRQFKLSESRAKEDYEISKSRAQEDFARSQADREVEFNIQRARSHEQFKIQMRDAAQDFQIQRKRSAEQFAIQMKDAEEDFKIQRKRSQEQFAIQMSDMKANFELERDLRKQAFQNSILPQFIKNEEALANVRAQFTQAQIDAYIQMYNDTKGGKDPTTGKDYTGRATGGYIESTKPYLMHEGEFVMSASTTRAAESLARGKSLTQENMMSMLLGGRHQVSMVNNFSRGVSSEERMELQKEFETMVNGAF